MKFKKGDRVGVVYNINNHNFPLGTIVEIKKVFEDEEVYKAYYLDGHDFWWLTDSEVERVEEPAASPSEHGIRISYFELPNGDVEIESVKALTFEKLPEEYVKGLPYTYLRENFAPVRREPQDWLRIHFSDGNYAAFGAGDKIGKETFVRYLDELHKCGDRLKEINNSKKRVKKTIVI